jgi:flagellar biosynthesis component FlhA
MYPIFHFVIDDSLKGGSFCFGINHLSTVPVVGLAWDRILVTELPGQLQSIGILSEPFINPATGKRCATVSRDAREGLQKVGLTSYDPLEVLMLCLERELRNNSERVIDRSLTESMVKEIGGVFPALEQAIETHLSLDHLTVILRRLVSEHIWVRDLPRIAELLLEHELFVSSNSSVDEQLSFVRSHLAGRTAT